MVDLIISVDGSAGSGKEKICKYIANKYSLFHLDSGIIYRRLVTLIIKRKINYLNLKELIFFLNSINEISIRKHKILRSEEVSLLSSNVAKIKVVRRFVNYQQKKIVKKILKIERGCVIDGRDIGSKVFQKAKIKLFIIVKPEIRAKRRHKQLIELGEKSIYTRILKDMNLRDKTDINRKESPLVIPKRALLIDNSGSFKKTINQINKALINI